MRAWIAGIMAAVLVLGAAVPVWGAEEYAGKAVVLMEASTGTVLYERNAHEPLSPASVTKVMTLLLIMEAIDGGLLRWDDPVTASAAAAAKGGSQVYLKEGETMTVEEMVKSIAVSSANDCACAMAELLAGSEAAFVVQMNEKARQLGMEDTCFVNCTGLDDAPEAREHKTSAYDIALMSRELLTGHPDIKKYTTIWMDSVRSGAFGLSNTNQLIRFYSGATGLKTGFTRTAGYCLSASACRDGMELIAVTLGCETSKDRFASCRGLLDWGFASYALFELPQEERTVPVELGRQDRVEVQPAQPVRTLVEKRQLNAVEVQTVLAESVAAPVSAGQKLGEVTLRCEGQILQVIPLVAAQPVERLRFGDLFRELLGMVCMAG